MAVALTQILGSLPDPGSSWIAPPGSVRSLSSLPRPWLPGRSFTKQESGLRNSPGACDGATQLEASHGLINPQEDTPFQFSVPGKYRQACGVERQHPQASQPLQVHATPMSQRNRGTHNASPSRSLLGLRIVGGEAPAHIPTTLCHPFVNIFSPDLCCLENCRPFLSG